VCALRSTYTGVYAKRFEGGEMGGRINDDVINVNKCVIQSHPIAWQAAFGDLAPHTSACVCGT
jgi:hypothetical protein